MIFFLLLRLRAQITLLSLASCKYTSSLLCHSTNRATMFPQKALCQLGVVHCAAFLFGLLQPLPYRAVMLPLSWNNSDGYSYIYLGWICETLRYIKFVFEIFSESFLSLFQNLYSISICLGRQFKSTLPLPCLPNSPIFFFLFTFHS